MNSSSPLSFGIGNSSGLRFGAGQSTRLAVAAGEILVYVGAHWFDGPQLDDASPFELVTRFVD